MKGKREGEANCEWMREEKIRISSAKRREWRGKEQAVRRDEDGEERGTSTEKGGGCDELHNEGGC